MADPADAVGQHVGHQDIGQAILVEIHNLQAADARRIGGGKPHRHRRQEIDPVAVSAFGGRLVGLFFAGAFENVREELFQ